MSEGLEWWTCRHCTTKRYCTEKAMQEHEEDCPQRPSQRMHKVWECGACGSMMERVTAVTHTSYICINVNCARTISLFKGGKL